MKVLVIPEDFRKDQYFLKPLFSQLLGSIAGRSARVRVCQTLLGGVGEALKSERIEAIIQQYQGTADIFILCVDRDGNGGRRQRLNQLEAEFGNGQVFLAENAWEELETWLLAGLDLPSDWRWQDVRAEVHVKEKYFEPLADERGVSDSPGGGRKILGEEAARRIDTIRQKCPEDFDSLANRIKAMATG